MLVSKRDTRDEVEMKAILMGLAKIMVLYSIGGALYTIIELLFRGHTHWTMFFVGGLCFVLVGAINQVYPHEMALISQMLIAAIIITAVEFASGMIINVWLGLGVWDYRHMPYNLYGQVCLVFFLAWFFLSPFAILLDDFLRYKMFGEPRPHYKIF